MIEIYWTGSLVALAGALVMRIVVTILVAIDNWLKPQNSRALMIPAIVATIIGLALAIVAMMLILVTATEMPHA